MNMKIIFIFIGVQCPKITAQVKLQMLNRNNCVGDMEGFGHRTEVSRKLLAQLGGCCVSWNSSRRNDVPLTQEKPFFIN